jgi:hypothetical protein
MQVGRFRDHRKKYRKMKKADFLGFVAFLLLFTCCTENKKAADPVGENKPVHEETSANLSSAEFTINYKKFTCDEVGAVGFAKDNKILINGHSNDEGGNVAIIFSLEKIGEGQRKFNTAGNTIEVDVNESYSNIFKEDCSDEKLFTVGSVTITKLINYSTEKSTESTQNGWIEGNFEGKLSVTRPVAQYRCSNGNISTSKTEMVNIKGRFAGEFISTNDVPL